MGGFFLILHDVFLLDSSNHYTVLSPVGIIRVSNDYLEEMCLKY